ncbi:hypothetical protein [Bradyrhizobium cosmicum]|uniref:hypothetical protein n=1 Tax=Bradyrhizobium cosmicum TaxID=1404864 RepID=UPI0028E74686|nr:hypothetical protein [Bradyrhizobium cosmicum]
MLSRLISLLRRIPAVKWAFTRLRPSSHGGSIDHVVRDADDSPAITEAAPALDGDISADPLHAGNEVAASVAADDTGIAVVAKSRSAAPADLSASDDPYRDTPAVAEPVVAAEVPVAPVEVENEPVVPEPVVAEGTPVAPVDIEIAPVGAPVLVVNDNPSSVVVPDVDPAVMEDACVGLAASDISTEEVTESSIDSAPLPSAAMEIEPVPDPVVVAAIAAEGACAVAPNVVTNAEPEPVLKSPASEVRSAPKPRAKATEPVDRATLIRQRWAETGIRMWNPRLHGAGSATLNIQGRVELLPPALGETMPRYDKLEFRMLGGQIVCEGVIVEAPAPASHRSFTQLAGPRNGDRAREPVRERQAAPA